MTTPKSPEQIMAEFYKELHNFISPSNCDCCKKMGSGHNMAHLYSSEIRDFLRSSMSSLLCYMAERMPEKKEGVETELGLDTPRGMYEHNKAIDDCRTLLIEEARKITDGV